jgi:hypothetical protein
MLVNPALASSSQAASRGNCFGHQLGRTRASVASSASNLTGFVMCSLKPALNAWSRSVCCRFSGIRTVHNCLFRLRGRRTKLPGPQSAASCMDISAWARGAAMESSAGRNSVTRANPLMNAWRRIDDHALIRDAVSMVLRRVRPTANIVERDCLSRLDADVRRQGPPELVCLDLNLPDAVGCSRGSLLLRCVHQ